ncbi:MAG: ankyrin repeat domain-containing protein [Syntrophaceae bacterium]|nr:ankyrin repeat domain-containing protein [Syntrophaceae bacterium]
MGKIYFGTVRYQKLSYEEKIRYLKIIAASIVLGGISLLLLQVFKYDGSLTLANCLFIFPLLFVLPWWPLSIQEWSFTLSSIVYLGCAMFLIIYGSNLIYDLFTKQGEKVTVEYGPHPPRSPKRAISLRQTNTSNMFAFYIGGMLGIFILIYALGLGWSVAKEILSLKNPDIKLVEAARRGRPAIVLEMLARGANKKEEALIHAADEGHTEVVRIVLDTGVNVNMRSGEMEVTPLMLAAEGNHLDVVRLLLARGAEVNLQSKRDNMTALDYAMHYLHTHEEVIDLLEEAGAKRAHQLP